MKGKTSPSGQIGGKAARSPSNSLSPPPAQERLHPSYLGILLALGSRHFPALFLRRWHSICGSFPEIPLFTAWTRAKEDAFHSKIIPTNHTEIKPARMRRAAISNSRNSNGIGLGQLSAHHLSLGGFTGVRAK